MEYYRQQVNRLLFQPVNQIYFRYFLALIVAVCIAIATWTWSPGTIFGDPMTQYLQAIGKAPVSDWHSPLFTRLWQLQIFLFGSSNLLVFFASAIIGIALWVLIQFRPCGFGYILYAVIFFSTPFFGQIALVWQDLFLSALLLLASGTILWSKQEGIAKNKKYFLFYFSLFILTICVLLRINAAFICAPIFVYLLFGWRINLKSLILSFVTVCILVVGNGFIDHKILKAKADHAEASLQIFDLGGIAHFLNPSLDDVSVFEKWDEEVVVNKLAACYMPARWDTYGHWDLPGYPQNYSGYDKWNNRWVPPHGDPEDSRVLKCANLGKAFRSLPPSILTKKWSEMIIHHPVAYLEARWAYFYNSILGYEVPGSVLPWPKPGYYLPSVDPMDTQHGFNVRNVLFETKYLESLHSYDSCFWNRGAFWITLGCFFLILTIKCSNEKEKILNCFSFASIMYLLGYFFVGVGNEFRYYLPSIYLLCAVILIGFCSGIKGSKFLSRFSSVFCPKKYLTNNKICFLGKDNLRENISRLYAFGEKVCKSFYKNRRLLFYFLAIFLIFLFPIIHANFLYLDCWRHSLGETNLIEDGRPLAQLQLNLLNIFNITDIAPLPQIVGVIILAFSVFALSLSLELPWLTAFGAFAFIFCNPFVLDCISFRFEAVSMLTAISFAIGAVAFLNYARYNKSIYSIAVAGLLIFGLLNLYQLYLNIFIIVVCISAVVFLLKGETIQSTFRYLLCAAAVTFSNVVIYFIERAVFPFLHSSYSDYHAQLNIHPLHILNNLCLFWKMIQAAFLQGNQSVLMFLILLGGLTSLVFRLCSFMGQKKDVIRSLFLILLLCVILVSVILPPALFLHPLLELRSLVGVAGVISLAVICLMGVERACSVVTAVKYSLIMFALLSEIVLSFAYGNAQKDFHRREQEILTQIDADISPILLTTNHFLTFSVIGELSLSPAVQHTVNVFPILNNIFHVETPTPAFSSSLIWAEKKMQHKGTSLGDGALIVDLGWTNNASMYNQSRSEMFRAVQHVALDCDVAKVMPHALFFTYFTKDSRHIIVDFSKRCIAPRKHYKIFFSRINDEEREKLSHYWDMPK